VDGREVQRYVELGGCRERLQCVGLDVFREGKRRETKEDVGTDALSLAGLGTLEMFSWYVAPGTVNASRCAVLRDWAADRGVAFRGHNTFWHSQRPDWLTDNSSISVQDLNETVIPYGVSTIIKQMGPSLISWDVVNEPW
jgi:hypothetical protein